MDKSSILILDCKGATKPAVCFCLEVAGLSTYVVSDENEAINLLSNAKTIDKSFSCLIVNDYNPEKDPCYILEAIDRSGVCEEACTIVFSSNREVEQGIFAPLIQKFSQLKIYTCQGAQVVDLVTALKRGG